MNKKMKLLPKRHWTARYVRDRLKVMWFEYRKPDLPWLTKDAIQMLDTMIAKENVGFEWGSGRSTLWLAQRVKHLTSVESDSNWFANIRSRLRELSLLNVDYHFANDIDRGAGSRYVNIIEECSPKSLDFVLVDGAIREHCCMKALSFLKEGGILVLDNANLYLSCRSYAPNSRTAAAGPLNEKWEEFSSLVQSWRCLWTSSGVADTAIWIKAFESTGRKDISVKETRL